MLGDELQGQHRAHLQRAERRGSFEWLRPPPGSVTPTGPLVHHSVPH